MSWLHRLIGRQGHSPRSYIRKWVRRHVYECPHPPESVQEILFNGMMLGVSSFAKERSKGAHKAKDKSRKAARDMHRRAARRYGTDGSLFEVGCYLYFRGVMWLKSNRRQSFSALANSVGDRFVELFGEALPNTDVSALFAERLALYCECAGTAEPVDVYHLHLAELIERTANGRRPAHYELGAPITLTGLLNWFSRQVFITAFERATVPAFFRTLEDYLPIPESEA